MCHGRSWWLAIGLFLSACAGTQRVRGFVYDDLNGDGLPSSNEPGIADAVVAFGTNVFVQTTSTGEFEIPLPADASGIVWVRVPDGFRPGPVWAKISQGNGDVDLGLRRSTAASGPLTFVVASDTHIPQTQKEITGADLAYAASTATALGERPAFFTILGDITQGNNKAEFELVDEAVRGLDVPYIPVPGNHDWYDGGATWFGHWGPDNYSFDIGDVHFVVWNMAMSQEDIRLYLGAELERVSPDMTVVAMTHAPPTDLVVNTLRDLGVDLVLTGHTHSNRAVDHGGMLQLNTQPMLMGGLDLTPAGYRVITIESGRLSSYHRSTVDEPFMTVVSPRADACVKSGAELIAAAELDGGASNLVARIDCGAAIPLTFQGGWDWTSTVPELAAGPHTVTVEGTTASGTRATATSFFEICDEPTSPPVGGDWSQLGGGPEHANARTAAIAPPLVTRWTATVGGHVVTAPPVISGGVVYVTVTDLGHGDTGGVTALSLATGEELWRVVTPVAIRGGVVVSEGTVIVPQIDGVVLGLDIGTGEEHWRKELSTGLASEAGALFGAPAADLGGVIVGHQRKLASLSPTTGDLAWTVDPVPAGRDSQSAAAVAIGGGIAVGSFERSLAGLLAWDRQTGVRRWTYRNSSTVAINATPVIDNDTIYIVSGAVEVTALDLNGTPRWHAKLDEAGFDWGHATIGTPAIASGVLVVPTLYRDLVALDAASGAELWRHEGQVGPLRTTHYRGGKQKGFAASPVITGDIVWAADTSGLLSAIELQTGRLLWQTNLGVPALAGLAVSGDWLVAATYDGTVRALVPTAMERATPDATACEPMAPVTGGGGGCSTTGRSSMLSLAFVILLLRRRSRRAA